MGCCRTGDSHQFPLSYRIGMRIAYPFHFSMCCYHPTVFVDCYSDCGELWHCVCFSPEAYGRPSTLSPDSQTPRGPASSSPFQLWTDTHKQTRIHTHTNIHTHIHTVIYRQTHKHTQINTFTHKYTQRHTQKHRYIIHHTEYGIILPVT